jgi:S1-C subfamily serine protease
MSISRFIRIAITVTLLSIGVAAQTPPAQPKQSPPPAPNEPRTATPQVVTIVHRLNGLKMFRLLRRSQEQVGAIAGLDEAFNLTDDVHTNIIAGLALEDGKTIAAWLPDADLEFGPAVVSPKLPMPPPAPNPRPLTPTPQLGNIEIEKFIFRGGMFGAPDLTVIGPDGQRMEAQYVGLDGATGLSILRLSDGNLKVKAVANIKGPGEGDNIRLIGPQPAENSGLGAGGNVLVRMGTTPSTLQFIRRFPTGFVARFKVKSPGLSLTNIGGVAVNEAGETVGIVDGIDGLEATILPAALIQRAAQRVLAKMASVPRPWLGVQGEAVSGLNWDQFKSNGWKWERATPLLERHQGILLTSIAPGSPAAGAALKAGDVILKVNNEEVHNGDEFSWMLDDAGPSTSVTLTFARPDRLTEEAVSVELSGVLNPNQALGQTPNPATPGTLIAQGIETVAIRPLVAAQLGAAPGLLVVYVDPTSVAFQSGLRPGDVIEFIDDKPVTIVANSLSPVTTAGAKSTFAVVRKKQKIVIKLEPARN